MDQVFAYVCVFGIIIAIRHFFQNVSIPMVLLFVIAGFLVGFLPFQIKLNLNPDIILNFFLPLLVYEICAFSSWRDIKKNIRPITLLSVGHVFFITVLVAVCIHAFIPSLGWPLSFVLGAVISPPDDVAIVSISKNVRIPERVLSILEGEAMFNDAAALTLFRFALAALVTHEFSAIQASFTFFAVIIGETLYGLVLGHLVGRLRKKITNPITHIFASILTPFLAYLPMVKLGGSGIIATAIVGFIIGNYYSIRFTPEFRLISRVVWPTISFAIESVLFFFIGFNMRIIFEGVLSIPIAFLGLYTFSIILVVILGRFIWEYFTAALPLLLFRSRRKADIPSWQNLFIISWSGMRGGISLAAALSIPLLPMMQDGLNPRNLIIFLVCCVIIATLVIQGMTLPWIIKFLGVNKLGQREQFNEHLAEVSAKIKMKRNALHWLTRYQKEIHDDETLCGEVKLAIAQYKMLLEKLKLEKSKHDTGALQYDEEKEIQDELFLSSQIIKVERLMLLKLWRTEKINLSTRNKLLARLDHQLQHLSSS